MNTPIGRTLNFYGQKRGPWECGDGTWIEPEEFCRTQSDLARRAYVVCPDGIKRVVRCGIPFTYSAMDGRGIARKGGPKVSGIVSLEDGVLHFDAYPVHAPESSTGDRTRCGMSVIRAAERAMRKPGAVVTCQSCRGVA